MCNLKRKPALLDIIRLDGSWAQMGGSRTAIYLKNRSCIEVDFGKYKIIKDYCSMPVWYVTRHQGAVFSDGEMANIRWGPEQEKHPELKAQVSVFAEYVRKE
jgi:hypothetical protein